MIELNLIASNEAETRIKEYLQENASEILAEKINNGTKINKNDKVLINKKGLSGFMEFATKEAKKLVAENSSFACVEDSTVFGWAIHYFEEDSIEGKLYNEDGTEFKVETKPIQKPKTETKIETKKVEIKKVNKQASFFDLIDNIEENNEIDTIENETISLVKDNEVVELVKIETEYNIEPITIEETIDEDNKEIIVENNRKIDFETVEIITQNERRIFNNYRKLYELLDNKLGVKL